VFYVLNLKLNIIFDVMKRPKDILSQPYHIQEYIKYLECKNIITIKEYNNNEHLKEFNYS